MLKESFTKILSMQADKVIKPEDIEKMTKADLLAYNVVEKAKDRGSSQSAIDIAKLTGEFKETPVTNISLGDALKEFTSGNDN